PRPLAVGPGRGGRGGGRRLILPRLERPGRAGIQGPVTCCCPPRLCRRAGGPETASGATLLAMPDAPNTAVFEAAPDEADLVDRLRSGDEGAYEYVLREYGARLFTVARRLMGNDSD